MQSSGWRRCPVWEWIRRNRSLPKWVPQQRPFLPRSLSSWVGACPGDEESAGVNYSHRSPKGNRHMRRILNQAANAAVKTKGSIFEIVYRRSVPRLGHKQTIGAIAHRLCRLIWMILHQGVRYEERGPAVTKQSKQRRTCKNDPATPKPRLPDRTTESSTQSGTSAVIFEPGKAVCGAAVNIWPPWIAPRRSPT